RVEPLGLKLEAAYSPEANIALVPNGGGALLGQSASLPQLSIVGGMDLERESGFNMIVEARYTPIFQVPIGVEVLRFDVGRLYTLGSRLEWTPGTGVVSFRFLGFVDVTSPSYALQPAIRVAGNDHLRVELAVAIYGGPDNSLGGAFDHNDEVLLT